MKRRIHSSGAFGGAEQERVNQLLVGFTFPE